MDDGHVWELRTERVCPFSRLGWATVFATKGKIFTIVDRLRGLTLDVAAGLIDRISQIKTDRRYFHCRKCGVQAEAPLFRSFPSRFMTDPNGMDCANRQVDVLMRM